MDAPRRATETHEQYAGPRFEVLDHTADAGILARAATLAEAFAAAAEGMYSLMVDLDGVQEHDAREIDVTGGDAAQLLERFLLELLFLTETERVVFRRFEVRIDGTALRARAFGEKLDRNRHELRGDVKAVTRHMTSVEEEGGGWAVRVLFDL